MTLNILCFSSKSSYYEVFQALETPNHGLEIALVMADGNVWSGSLATTLKVGKLGPT
jgi:hypothetical protein